MLYERRPVKARADERARPHIDHYDTVPIGPLATATADCGIDLGTLADARQAVAEHLRGLT